MSDDRTTSLSEEMTNIFTANSLVDERINTFENVTNSLKGMTSKIVENASDTFHKELGSSNIWLDGSYWLWRIAVPAIVLLGTLGNIMIVIVLRRVQSTTPSPIHIFLTTLAVTDTITLYFGLGRRWGKFVVNFDVFEIHSLACKSGPWVMNVSAAISSWCLVAMTTQRAASVVFPHKVKAVCARGKTKMAVAGVVCFQILFYSHMLYGVDLMDGSCVIADVEYKQFWVEGWVMADLVAFSLLPFSLIALANAVLVWHLAVSVAETRRRLTSSENSLSHLTHRKKQASSMTLTIVAMSLTFLVTTSPVSVLNIVENVNGQDSLADNPEKLIFLYHFTFFLGSCNFAVNFYLYCLTGTKFRHNFLALFSGCCGKMTSYGQSQSKGRPPKQLMWSSVQE